MNKEINKYISSIGFINIDIIFNDEFYGQDSCIYPLIDKCSNNSTFKNCKDKLTGFFVNSCSKILDTINYFFKINEGFYHKHFSIMNYSYNFNEKNVIFTFNSKYDTSKKNRIRIFDIYFEEFWTTYISDLILFLYKKCFFFNTEDYLNFNFKSIFGDKNKEKNLNNNENINNNNNKLNKKNNQKDIFIANYKSFISRLFFKKFSNVINIISRELITKYTNNFPDFKSLCRKISKFPIKKYNSFDNVCQHFANYSLEILLAKIVNTENLIDKLIEKKYREKCDEEKVFNIHINKNKKKDKIIYKMNKNLFNLNKIYEPFLNHIDGKLLEIIKNKNNIESYLKKNNINEDFYFTNVKKILKTNKNLHSNLFFNDRKGKINDDNNNKSENNQITFCENNENPYKINQNNINIEIKKNRNELNKTKEDEKQNNRYNFNENICSVKSSVYLNMNFSNENQTFRNTETYLNSYVNSNYLANLNMNTNINKDNLQINEKIQNLKSLKKFEILNPTLQKSLKNNPMINQNRKFDFYFYDNLSNIFVYKEIQKLFELSKDYFFIKKYNNYMKHNLNISFDKRERSIFNAIPENMKPRKNFVKRKKVEIMKSLNNIKKVSEKNKRLNFLFYEYLKEKNSELENFFLDNTNYFRNRSRLYDTKDKLNLESHINDTLKSEIKNLTYENNNSGFENYFSYRIGHVYFVFRKKPFEIYKNVDSLIDYLTNDFN